MRFSRSLERAGFAKDLARSIAAALGEMADNIVQHANQPATAYGVIAYQIASRSMCFAVADIGQGVLNSLSRSPAWIHLRSDRDALSAAVPMCSLNWRKDLDGFNLSNLDASGAGRPSPSASLGGEAAAAGSAAVQFKPDRVAKVGKQQALI